MPEEIEEQDPEEDEELEEKALWRKPKKNWGFWVLIITFILFLITWYIIKPWLEGRGG